MLLLLSTLTIFSTSFSSYFKFLNSSDFHCSTWVFPRLYKMGDLVLYVPFPSVPRDPPVVIIPPPSDDNWSSDSPPEDLYNKPETPEWLKTYAASIAHVTEGLKDLELSKHQKVWNSQCSTWRRLSMIHILLSNLTEQNVKWSYRKVNASVSKDVLENLRM